MLDARVFRNINHFTALPEKFVKGRKEKIWLRDENGELYLFKKGASNYEPLAEILAYTVAKQCGLNAAEYELATYGGDLGVISKNFLKEGCMIYSGDKMKKLIPEIMQENNCERENLDQHSLENIIAIICLFVNKSDINNITNNLFKMWVFDGVMMESDRNATNWSLIHDRNSRSYKLAPLYDCSTVARLNNDVASFVPQLRNENDIYNLTKDIKSSMCYDNIEPVDNFMDHFARFCKALPNHAEISMKMLDKINIRAALEEIEGVLSIQAGCDYTIPYNVSLWIEKSIGQRISDMRFTYQKNYENDIKRT
ncbi:MAG: HipA domain-containing protein [bacterium]